MRQQTGKTLECLQCKKSFYAPPHRLKAGAEFCSVRCSALSHWQRPAYRTKMKHAHSGNTASPETRHKMSLAQKAHIARSGANRGFVGIASQDHWNWKGGITTLTEKLRKSSRYTQWRTSVFARDDYVCQACGERGGRLHAHHDLPFSQFPDLRFEVLNGMTLCVPCHKKTPTFGGAITNSVYA